MNTKPAPAPPDLEQRARNVESRLNSALPPAFLNALDAEWRQKVLAKLQQARDVNYTIILDALQSERQDTISAHRAEADRLMEAVISLNMALDNYWNHASGLGFTGMAEPFLKSITKAQQECQKALSSSAGKEGGEG